MHSLEQLLLLRNRWLYNRQNIHFVVIPQKVQKWVTKTWGIQSNWSISYNTFVWGMNKNCSLFNVNLAICRIAPKFNRFLKPAGDCLYGLVVWKRAVLMCCKTSVCVIVAIRNAQQNTYQLIVAPPEMSFLNPRILPERINSFNIRLKCTGLQLHTPVVRTK